MHSVIAPLVLFLLLACSTSTEESLRIESSTAGNQIDWTGEQDFTRLLDNPHKGWYHHVYDNGTQEYGPKQPGDVLNFPSLDHLYVRIPWALLEPERDAYDWSRIDALVATYTTQGIGLAFAVTSKETSVPYGAPAWLTDLGVEMEEFEEWGLTFYEPDYGHPAFIAQLREFQQAMADRYGEADWLRYVQVASYGNWGEGHNWPHSDRNWPHETLTAHLEAYRDAWPDDVTLTITDDWVGNARTPEDTEFYRQYIRERGLTWTDHSVLVDYYIDNFPATYSIRSPELFEETYLQGPIPVELEHFRLVKESGNWSGQNGVTVGADILRGAIETTHASYVGFHHFPDEYRSENPQLVVELANTMGYYYTLHASDVPERATAGGTLSLTMDWENRGVAPAYQPLVLRLTLSREGDTTELSAPFPVADIELNTVHAATVSYDVPASVAPGEYAVSFQLYDPSGTGEVIDLALRSSLSKSEQYWPLGTLVVD